MGAGSDGAWAHRLDWTFPYAGMIRIRFQGTLSVGIRTMDANTPNAKRAR